MNRRQVITNTIFALVSAFLVQKISYAEPANLALLVNEVKTYHDSGNYQNELAAAIQNAGEFIVKRAKENSQQPQPQKLAIVLDIDETCISNYKKMAARDFSAANQEWKKDVLAANAPPIKPMLHLYEDAIAHHIAVFFVTGRHESQRVPTSKNLSLAGYKGWSAIYLKPDDYHQNSAIPFKSHARETIEKQGYTIIASIGDQYSDLNGGHAERTFKLPNPYYFIP